MLSIITVQQPTVTAASESAQSSWPAFHVPYFELYAQDMKELTKAEYVGVNNVVYPATEGEFLQYSKAHYQQWIEEAHMLSYGNLDKLDNDTSVYRDYIYKKKEGGGFEPDIPREIYFARTTQSPPPRTFGPLTNFNIGSLGANEAIQISAIAMKNEPLVSVVKPFQALPPDEHQGFHTDDAADNPHSFVYYPVRKHVNDEESEVVATVNAAIAWDASMRDLLPSNVYGIICVIQNSCQQTYSYRIAGTEAFYLGEGDHHDPRYDHMRVDADLSLHTHPNFTTYPGHCTYSMYVIRRISLCRLARLTYFLSCLSLQSVYPSSTFEAVYVTNFPVYFVTAVAITFVLVAVTFSAYDMNVKCRNDKIVSKAAKANGLIASFFPDTIRDRVLANEDDLNQPSQDNRKSSMSSLENFLSKGSRPETTTSLASEIKPLADHFPEVTYSSLVTKCSFLR